MNDVRRFHHDVFVGDRERMVYVRHLNEAMETDYGNESVGIDLGFTLRLPSLPLLLLLIAVRKKMATRRRIRFLVRKINRRSR